jgi:hypothetical protein
MAAKPALPPGFDLSRLYDDPEPEDVLVALATMRRALSRHSGDMTKPSMRSIRLALAGCIHDGEGPAFAAVVVLRYGLLTERGPRRVSRMLANLADREGVDFRIVNQIVALAAPIWGERLTRSVVAHDRRFADPCPLPASPDDPTAGSFDLGFAAAVVWERLVASVTPPDDDEDWDPKDVAASTSDIRLRMAAGAVRSGLAEGLHPAVLAAAVRCSDFLPGDILRKALSSAADNVEIGEVVSYLLARNRTLGVTTRTRETASLEGLLGDIEGLQNPVAPGR